MVVYKLHYLAGRGLGEVPRQLFILSETPFEDIRYTKEEFEKHAHEFPFGKVPVLEIDDFKLAQSAAITRYLARKFGYAGIDPLEQAMIDAVYDQQRDFLLEMVPYYAVLFKFVEGDLEKLYNEVLVPVRAKHFVFFTKLLKESTSGFLVGDSLTFTDLFLAEMASSLFGGVKGFLDDYPAIRAHSEKVRSIPLLKKWIQTRPESVF